MAQIVLLIRSLGHAFDAMAAVAVDLKPHKPLERPVTRTQIQHANQLLDLAEQIITASFGGKITMSLPDRFSLARTNYTTGGFSVDEVAFIQMAPTRVLTAVLAGKLDLNLLARQELACRGVNENGVWVGFNAALKVHRLSEV